VVLKKRTYFDKNSTMSSEGGAYARYDK
jgi:hypothetical protein